MQQHYVSMMQRSETLPNDADPSSLKSEYRNGVLILTLQKKKSLKHPVVKDNKKTNTCTITGSSKRRSKRVQ